MITHSIPRLPEPEPDFSGELDGSNERQSDPNSVDYLAHLYDIRDALNHFESMEKSGVRDENDPSDTLERRRAAQQAEHDQALASFARAYLGAEALRAEGAYDRHSPEFIEAWNAFQPFKRAYASPRQAEKRNIYWKQLTNRIAELEGKTPPYTLELPNRRVPGSANYPARLGEGEESESPPDTRAKLRILSERDPRAGFLPATHREKNSAVAALDYLGEKEGQRRKPDRINDQLLEIYNRQVNKRIESYAKAQAAAREAEKVAAKAEGREQNFVWDGPSATEIAVEAREVAVDTVRSVINEWDDSSMDAQYSLGALVALADVAEKIGTPKMKLSELLATPEAAGLDPMPFLRYLVLKWFRDTGELPGFDPLLTREIRPAPPEFIYKNKIVVGPFMHVPDREQLGEDFQAMLDSIEVRTIREVSPEAIEDSRRRHAYFARLRTGITGEYAEFARSVSRASKAAA